MASIAEKALLGHQNLRRREGEFETQGARPELIAVPLYSGSVSRKHQQSHACWCVL